MAKAMNCHSGFVSKVLGKDHDLSLEQGAALAKFLGFTQNETKYFLLLVLRGRAGTDELAKIWDNDLAKLRQHGLKLKELFSEAKTIPFEDQVRYYSHWYFTAVHSCLSVPALRTEESISRFLGLSPRKTKRILQFLESASLAVKTGHEYHPQNVDIHLGDDSPMIVRHHSNLRALATERLEDRSAEGEIHYTSVISVGRADLAKARSILLDAIREIRSLVKESNDETVACYCVDLFELENR